MRLEAVPEMNYLPTDNPPRGEICFRGPTVFSGYYKQEDKTVEVLDKDGWFHTGDIGELTAAGAVRIFDRKKNIFKLAQGEYIAVEKVEAVYKKNPLVEQIWVYGNSFESTLVAVVVPIEDRLRAGVKEQSSGSFAELCKSDAARTYVLQSLNETAKEGSLKGFEQIKSVYLDPNQFSVENEMMTPTFKLKRPQLQKYYQAQVDAMYKSINQK
jgi:long-chain acyl-CoA synthetase